MIDLRAVRDDPDRVRASQRARGEDPEAVDALLAADERRRAAIFRADRLRAEQKALGKEVARTRGDERAALLQKAQDLSGEVKVAEGEQAVAEAEMRATHLAVPNVIEDGAPPGGEDDDDGDKAPRRRGRRGGRGRRKAPASS